MEATEVIDMGILEDQEARRSEVERLDINGRTDDSGSKSQCRPINSIMITCFHDYPAMEESSAFIFHEMVGSSRTERIEGTGIVK